MANEDKLEDNQEQVIEFTPIQQEAAESGWVPKDQYTGDPDKWVDAAEFIRRGELFKKIETQSRAIKDLNKAIQDIQALHAKSREIEYKRALETIRKEKKLALEEGDADAVIEADEKMEMLREAQRQDTPKQQEASGEEHPEFVNWKAKNTWYETNKGMKAYADTIGAELRAGGMSPSDVLREVERKVREEFPNRFKNPNQEKPNAVEGGGTPNGRKGSVDNYTLDDNERSIMNNLVRLGVMTKEQYIAELKKVKGE